jgi:Domain of unknown function (DUF1929)
MSKPRRPRTRTASLVLSLAAVGVLAGGQVALAGAHPAHPAKIGVPDPKLPQLGELPGLSSLPNLSGVPGAPGIQGLTNTEGAAVTNPAVGGSFSAPFAQPGVNCPHETEGSPAGTDTGQDISCKPAGVSVVVLPNGEILYWDGLEAEENVNTSVVAEFGDKAANDQSRVLDLYGQNGPTWTTPSPGDGGADDSQYRQYLVPNAPGPLKPILNDPGSSSGALFCSDQVLLDNGELLVPGGTDYYAEPRIPGTPYGVVELEGVRNTRVFDPADNTWSETGAMNYGRWYPSLVTLGNGNVFVASGVTKLLKPVYSENPLLSGTNVEQTETFDTATGKWTYNGAKANHSLPLFPRIHLLPDGNVYYDAGGQTFNPFGEAYDEALWDATAVYNPTTKSWRDVGVPVGVNTDSKDPTRTALTAGFRGSSFDVQLPLTAPYTSASFLSAGGVAGVSPGTYLANDSSVIDTVNTAKNDAFSSKATGPLNNARWFSTGVVLPTGNVLAFNGANRDDVLLPGTSFPVQQTEEFDPSTNTWTKLASSIDPRTYHNTAVLLPTGQVLVGGNSPISTVYAYNQTLPGGFSNDFRDPSFELYNPPYLNWGIAQPTITNAPTEVKYGKTITIATKQPASEITKVALVRNTALTHTVDGDQKTIDMPILRRSGHTLTLGDPPTGNVAPPGSYMLFADEKTAKGLIPSVAKQVSVGVPMPAYAAGTTVKVPTAAKLASRIHTLTASYTSASATASTVAPRGEGQTRTSTVAPGLLAGTGQQASAASAPQLPAIVTRSQRQPSRSTAAGSTKSSSVVSRHKPARRAAQHRTSTRTKGTAAPSRETLRLAASPDAPPVRDPQSGLVDLVGIMAVLTVGVAQVRRRRRRIRRG